jgi:hypothetical protein
MPRADVRLPVVVFALALTIAAMAAVRAQTPAPAQGTLRLEIDPPSLVLIDNKEIGEVAERSLELPPGAYRVRIAHPEFQPLRRTIDVRAGAVVELKIDLYERGVPRNPAAPPKRPPPPAPRPVVPEPQAPAPTPQDDAAAIQENVPQPKLEGELRVRIDPPAEVWVDDVRKGIFGQGTIPVTLGRHDLRIVHPDYLPLNRRLTVSREKPGVLELKLAERAVPKARQQP